MPSPMLACHNAITPESAHDADVGDDFGIYIHWPFCVSKCPYCDFNSHVVKDGIDSELWLKMLCAELDTLNEQIRLLKKPISVFFGG